MARLRTNVLKWGNKYDGPNTYKMGREGALDDAYWDEDELVDYTHRTRNHDKKKYKRVKPVPGCPGNDYNDHVYVWVPDESEGMLFFKHYGYHKSEVKRCVGCGVKHATRLTEKYGKVKARKYAKMHGDEFSVTRGKPVGRRRYKPSYTYFRWERFDPAFMERVEEYARKHNNPYILNGYRYY